MSTMAGGATEQLHGVGEAAADVLVDGQRKRVEQLGVPEEDEVVVLGEVLEDESKTPEGGGGHEVGAVDDEGEHLAALVFLVSLIFDEALLALEVATVGLGLESLAQDAKDGVIGCGAYGWQRWVSNRLGSCEHRACLMTLLPVPGSPTTRHSPPG